MPLVHTSANHTHTDDYTTLSGEKLTGMVPGSAHAVSSSLIVTQINYTSVSKEFHQIVLTYAYTRYVHGYNVSKLRFDLMKI
jgi:hypothetical protein